MAFEPFSPAHWAGLAFTALVVFMIVAFRSRLRSRRADRAARWVMAGVLIASELGLYGWYSVTNNWGLHALPCQLCTITLWLSAVMLVSGNCKLYEIAFFLGILGAVQALATPSLNETFPHFRYFHFFIAHAEIVAASVYMTAAAGYRPGLRPLLRAWCWLNGFAAIAGVANAVTGENFMFLARKPDTASLLDMLAPWPWYILQLEVVAVLLCLLLLGIVRGADRLSGNGTKKRLSKEMMGS